MTATVAISKSPSPEVKKLRNDKTPTPHAQAKALFLKQNEPIKQGPMAGTEESLANKELCKENEQQKEIRSQVKHQDMTAGPKTLPKETQEEIITTKESTDQSTMQQTRGTREEQICTAGGETSTLEVKEPDKMAEDTKQLAAQEKISPQDEAKTHPQEQKEPEEQVEDTPKILIQLSPKEWQQTHDKWLHSAMHAAIRDELAPDVENINRFQEA